MRGIEVRYPNSRPRARKAGKWYFAPQGAFTTRQTTAGKVYYVPLPVEAPHSIDKLGCYVSTVGSAGSVTRLGIYDSDSSGWPNALLGGDLTVATAAGSTKSITLAAVLALLSGLYWLALVSQGAPATEPTFYGINGNGEGSPWVPVNDNGSGSPADAYATALTQTGVAGALPATAAPDGWFASPPGIAVRVA